MGPFAIAALGAGALVTTAAAGIVLLRRKVLGKAVQVDVEKGLEENILERREGTGPGWKEYVEVDEKATSELLVPLVGAFHAQKETDVVDANPFQAPLTLKPPLAALNQCPDPPARSVRHQFGPIPVPMGDISDTHNWDHAPVFPPGLPVPARAVAVARPISARLHPLSELGPLDTGVSGITSWPVLAPTPIEEMRARSDGQGEQVQLDVKDDVAPQDDLSASSPKFPREQPIAPSSLGLPVSSGIIDESGEVDPFGDPTDSVHSPCSEVSLGMEESISPACTPRSVSNSLDDSGPQSSDAANVNLSSAPSITCPSPSVKISDTTFPVNAPLPEPPPMSPKVVSSLLIHTLPPETVASAAVIFGGELSPTVDVSDQESSRPIITTPSVPVLAPIITTSYIEEDTNEAPCSPLSDTGSSSGGDSSGPETPSELKRELPFSAALELSSKEAPSLQLTVYLPPEGDPAIDEDVEFVDDFVIVGHHAPDPPSPIINTVPSEWTTSKLPGSFEEFTTSTGDRTSPEHKSTGTITVADVPPLTADMIQLCHALLAVSNCAGLVAQFVVGFSVWWSLTLVPA